MLTFVKLSSLKNDVFRAPYGVSGLLVPVEFMFSLSVSSSFHPSVGNNHEL